MPAGQINDLLQIVAVMNVMTGVEGPFMTHKDLYSAINMTNLGDAPWSHFNLNYQSDKGANPPSWQTKDFTVWFHNPLSVIHNLLSNPDFDGGFYYALFQKHNKNNNHQYENFMSGNWS